MATKGTDKSGRTRIACSRHTESRTCPRPQTFYLDVVEKTALDALRAELRDPVVISEYVREYHAERKRLASTSRNRRDAIAARLVQVEHETQLAVDAIVKQLADAAVMGRRTKDLAAEEAELQAELAQLGEAPAVVELHPAVLAKFEAQVASLQVTLDRGLDAGDQDAAMALRELIESVTVDRQKNGALEIRVAGRLEPMLGNASATPFMPRTLSGGSVVAGEGLEPPTYGL